MIDFEYSDEQYQQLREEEESAADSMSLAAEEFELEAGYRFAIATSSPQNETAHSAVEWLTEHGQW